MITVKETTERTLASPADIVEFLSARYATSRVAAPFAPGDVVDITARAGLPAGLGIGDVAVVVASIAGQPFTHVLLLNDAGGEMVVQVMTANLTKHAAETPAAPAEAAS